ncbi:MAG: hypothetical protein ACN4GT_08120 [Gammaproteobacteria bacterium]
MHGYYARKRDGPAFTTTATLPDTSRHPGDRAVIVWVSTTAGPTPIQSVGGYLP